MAAAMCWSAEAGAEGEPAAAGSLRNEPKVFTLDPRLPAAGSLRNGAVNHPGAEV